MNDALSMWVVYDHPRDHPDKWVARRWEVRAGITAATSDVRFAESLDALRDMIPPGLAMIPRVPQDDPAIAEVWL